MTAGEREVTIKPSDLMGRAEAADYLGHNVVTISRWARDGYMPAPFKKIGNGPLWLRQDLEPFRASHRQRADAAGRRPAATTPQG